MAVPATQPDYATQRANALLDEVARHSAHTGDVGALAKQVGLAMCTVGGYTAAAVVAPDGSGTNVVGRLAAERRLVAQVRASGRSVISRQRADGTYRAALPVTAENGSSTVMVLAGTANAAPDRATRTSDEAAVLDAVSAQLQTVARVRHQLADAVEGRKHAEVLMAISREIGSELDLPRVLEQIVDRAIDLFDADRAGVFSRTSAGKFVALTTRNLSSEFCQMIEHATRLPIAAMAFEDRRVVSVRDLPDDPRALDLRHGLIREGINTMTLAPLISEGEQMGALALYHSESFEMSPQQLALLEQVAHQAATMLRNAQNYSQMAKWAAQLQSIQQLGARLTRLRTVEEIGQAICSELNQLIDFHNVRVYRVVGEDCVPVAWRGEIGEYIDEDKEQLRIKVGEGLTGWVARHGLAQNVGDAANDRRAKTIPGTEDDLDESLLLAPMIYEDEVIGEIVLAKLGLHQFSADDLRLLEIYASIAAQAMANADATERLREQSESLARQLSSQRELLRVTESILSTLDTQQLLQEIAERLNTIVAVDNFAVCLHDASARRLRPIFARGVHAARYLKASINDADDLASAALATGRAQLMQDNPAENPVTAPSNGHTYIAARIVAPLRDKERVQGVLILERLGAEARFTDEEFELVQLFAAHVSISLQNAAAHRAVELRAETDHLTGLWNHGALIQHLDQLVGDRNRFAALMVDLDFFKLYNDRFGHQAGNVMLRHIADLLRTACRESDRVFRYGGDEFAILLPSTGLAGARTVAEKIQAAVESVTNGRPMSTPLTCSIGIAVFPKDGIDGHTVILAADRACYAGKRAGRARIATAAEGLALAAEFQPTEPTPAIEPTYSAA